MAEKGSRTSLEEATRGRAEFSGHGDSLGAKGHYDIDDAEAHKDDVLVDASGETAYIEKPESGPFPDITITLSWDRVEIEKERTGLMAKLFGAKKVIEQPADLDLGCLYELQNGDRGCLQAFGDMFGSMDEPPYIHHTGDETTGDTEGIDEEMIINGAKWGEIKRVLFYMYIYQGSPDWRTVLPEVMIDIPGSQDLKMSPHAKKPELVMCAVGMVENVDGGNLKLTNFSEYFPGHAEMDRAYGFGLEWEDGAKD